MHANCLKSGLKPISLEFIWKSKRIRKFYRIKKNGKQRINKRHSDSSIAKSEKKHGIKDSISHGIANKFVCNEVK